MTRIYNEVITGEQYLIANRNGISKKNVYQRVNEYGWSIEKAITKPLNNTKNKKTDRHLMLLAELNGINYATYRQRIKDGMDPHEAAVKCNKYSMELQMALDNGIGTEAFYTRLRRGMTPYEAATKPLKHKNFSKEYKEELEIAKSNGIAYQTFYKRVMDLGFDPMEAATKKPIKRISNAAIAIKNGISEKTYYQRVYKGWSKEDAMTIPVVKNKRYFNREQKANLHRSTSA
ncbi:hypothetical protein [Bacillus cereus]|uniref:hypothetical protein n=1 Tax=Bacillus cereus TaxID=1396 RepID=UPI0007E97E02|nr:hypothetical protein [Bacillus cereus]